MKTLIAVGFTAVAVTLAPGAVADTNFPVPTWPGSAQDDQGTWDDPTGSYHGDEGSYDEMLNIPDEDNAHPGTMYPAGPAHSPNLP